MSKTRTLFNRQRQRSPAAQKRLDIGIAVTGLIIACVLAVLTWINFQNRNEPIAAGATDSLVTINRQTG